MGYRWTFGLAIILSTVSCLGQANDCLKFLKKNPEIYVKQNGKVAQLGLRPGVHPTTPVGLYIKFLERALTSTKGFVPIDLFYAAKNTPHQGRGRFSADQYGQRITMYRPMAEDIMQAKKVEDFTDHPTLAHEMFHAEQYALEDLRHGHNFISGQGMPYEQDVVTSRRALETLSGHEGMKTNFRFDEVQGHFISLAIVLKKAASSQTIDPQTEALIKRYIFNHLIHLRMAYRINTYALDAFKTRISFNDERIYFNDDHTEIVFLVDHEFSASEYYAFAVAYPASAFPFIAESIDIDARFLLRQNYYLATRYAAAQEAIRQAFDAEGHLVNLRALQKFAQDSANLEPNTFTVDPQVLAAWQPRTPQEVDQETALSDPENLFFEQGF